MQRRPDVARRPFVAVCRYLKPFSQALVAVDGSKFKAVNTRDKNFTAAKIDKRQQQIEESIHRYLAALDTADRTQPVEVEARTPNRLNDKIDRLRKQMRAIADRGYYSAPQIKACAETDIDAMLPKPTTSNAKAEGHFDRSDFIHIAKGDEYQCPAGQRAPHRFRREGSGLQLRCDWSSACAQCAMKERCTPSAYRRISRWEHEAVLEAAQRRLD